jgi:hypothetical protein
LCNGAGMPIMVVDGLGCRGDAAEIIPMEPVWVLPIIFPPTLSTALTVSPARV